MILSDIMSKNIIVSNIKNSIYDIAKMMLENDIGFVPIVDGNKVKIILQKKLSI